MAFLAQLHASAALAPFHIFKYIVILHYTGEVSASLAGVCASSFSHVKWFLILGLCLSRFAP